MSSFLQYKVGQEKKNADACERTLTKDQYERFIEVIKQDYRFRLYTDGLPSAVVNVNPITGHRHQDYDDGIPVGKVVYDENGNEKYILYNHWNMVIKLQPIDQTTQKRIVGFEVEPRSFGIKVEPTEKDFNKPLYLDDLMKLPAD